jgi:hypothetical protein
MFSLQLKIECGSQSTNKLEGMLKVQLTLMVLYFASLSYLRICSRYMLWFTLNVIFSISMH